MSIKVGDKVPNINFTTMTADGPGPVGYDDLFAEKELLYFQYLEHSPQLAPYSICLALYRKQVS